MAINTKSVARYLVVMALLFMLGLSTSISTANPGGSDAPDTEFYLGQSSSGQLHFNSVDDPDYTGPWCPGLSKKTTVRVYNSQFREAQVTNLGVWAQLSDGSRFNLFMDNMLLTINQKGDPATQLYQGPLGGILYQEGSAQYPGYGVDLDVDRDSYVDLEYILAMDEEAPNEMQGLVAENFTFTINAEEVPQQENGGGGDIDYDGYDVEPAPAALALDHWAHDCIMALIANGVIIPETDGEIRPDDSITRAEAAVFLARALGLPVDENAVSGYLDQLPDFARGYIVAVTQAGVFKGYPVSGGYEFRPNSPITREELTCVLVRAFDKQSSGGFELTFDDQGQISGWALAEVTAGVQNGVITGYPDNTFRPQNPMTRAETFTLLCKLRGIPRRARGNRGR